MSEKQCGGWSGPQTVWRIPRTGRPVSLPADSELFSDERFGRGGSWHSRQDYV